MTTQYFLRERRKELIAQLKKDFENARVHSKGFVLRLLGSVEIKNVLEINGFDFTSLANDIKYGGSPYLAYLGFGIGSGYSNSLEQPVIDAFIAGLHRLQGKNQSGLQEFLTDDVAVLGVADGIARLGNLQIESVISSKEWFLNLLNEFPPKSLWSNRLRDLAGDLLDDRGRLRGKIVEEDPVRLALELSLRDSWPYPFRNSVYPDQKSRNDLLKSLLVDLIPRQGDIELICVWHKALDLLIDKSVEALTPSISDITHILQRTQHSFKRWVWDENSRRGQTDPAHWLIDNELHVQSFLWAVLYPIFGQDIVDEKYLPSYGQVQPRFDLGIIKLKLIIEVKVVRERGDFAKIEEEIAGDLGLYFKETDQFDRMVIYIYDDCNIYYPERYDALVNALKS